MRSATRFRVGSRRPQSLTVLREAIEALVVMMSPFAPHTAEELWEMTGHAGGHRRARRGRRSTRRREGRGDRRAGAGQRQAASRLTVPADTPESELRERALAEPAVRQHIEGKTIKTVVVAKGKLINVVVQ